MSPSHELLAYVCVYALVLHVKCGEVNWNEFDCVINILFFF